MKNITSASKPIPRTESKAITTLSRIGSFVFHPLFIPAIMTFVLYKAEPRYFSGISSSEFGRWMSMLALSTILFPFLVIVLLRLSGLISNARMHDAKDRTVPLISTLIVYIWTYNFFDHQEKTPLLLQVLLLGSCCALVIIFSVNLFYKVSVHTTAAAIMPGILIVSMMEGRLPVTILPGAIIAALIVGIVRWFLGAHTVGQILIGYFIGISMQIAAYFFLKA